MRLMQVTCLYSVMYKGIKRTDCVFNISYIHLRSVNIYIYLAMIMLMIKAQILNMWHSAVQTGKFIKYHQRVW